MATTELTCERHRTPTHLACAQCDRPACPKCLVWTEVGQKCRTCVHPKGGSSRLRPVQLVVVVGLAAALVLAISAAFGGFSGDAEPKVPVAGNTGQRQAGIGQPARDGILTFVVTGFECVGKEIGEGPLRRTALGRFCILRFTTTNTGNRPAALIFPQQVLLDRQKRRFEPDAAATGIHQRINAPAAGIAPVQQLNPGAQIASSLVYDVPEDVTPELAELHAGRSLGVTVRLSGSTA